MSDRANRILRLAANVADEPTRNELVSIAMAMGQDDAQLEAIIEDVQRELSKERAARTDAVLTVADLHADRERLRDENEKLRAELPPMHLSHVQSQNLAKPAGQSED